MELLPKESQKVNENSLSEKSKFLKGLQHRRIVGKKQSNLNLDLQ